MICIGQIIIIIFMVVGVIFSLSFFVVGDASRGRSRHYLTATVARWRAMTTKVLVVATRS